MRKYRKYKKKFRYNKKKRFRKSKKYFKRFKRKRYNKFFRKVKNVVNKIAEKKVYWVVNSYFGVLDTPLTIGLPNLLAGILQGNAYYNKIGRKIFVKKVTI